MLPALARAISGRAANGHQTGTHPAQSPTPRFHLVRPWLTQGNQAKSGQPEPATSRKLIIEWTTDA
jgi:hypothetical protein